MLGRALVFKTLRGKTILASRPSPPTKQSEQQRLNRSKFKEASFWAKSVIRDPANKEYYDRKAKKLKLPNAYTAAITDYMRTPQVKEIEKRLDTVTYKVSKKDFDVKSIELKVVNAKGEEIETRALVKDKLNDWTFKLSREELRWGVWVYVMNAGGNLTRIKLQVS